MSAVETQESLRPVLVRSRTPAPNEKVLRYLETMSNDKPDTTPPRSIVDPVEFRRADSVVSRARSPQPIQSPVARSKTGASLLGQLANGNGAAHQPEEDGDADSNVQEGVRSEMGESAAPVREPGPQDPPGPKYESYDSGPSFGNLGPLPDDGSLNNPWNSKGVPEAIVPAPTGLTNGRQSTLGMTPGNPARIPLPPSEFAFSPKATTLNVNTSQKPPSAMGREEPLSPRTANGRASVHPLSPRSKQGTVYPPLPESRFGDDETNYGAPMSPRSRTARSKAPSISPSDSPSQMKVRKTKSSVEAPMEFSPRSSVRQMQGRSQHPGSVMSANHQNRPFSPYRHAPTHEDLLNAAARGQALAIPIPEEDEKASSVARSNMSQSPSKVSKVPSQMNGTNGKAPSQTSQKQPSVSGSRLQQQTRDGQTERDGDMTPRPLSPNDLDAEEAQIVRDALANRTPRTSYYAATLEPEMTDHYHDMELCVLLHQESDPTVHEYVKKALRKAVRQRVKKLGMKYDSESIKQYKKSHHDHDPSVHLENYAEDPPKWALDIKRELVLMQQRIESLGPKIENLAPANNSFNANDSRLQYEGDEYTRTPVTQTVNIQTQPGTAAADSMYQIPHSEVLVDDNEHDFDDRYRGFPLPTDGETRTQNRSQYAMSEDRDDSPGQQLLEEELYKLRQKPRSSQSARSHRTWEVAPEDEEDPDEYDADGQGASGLPTIPDTNGNGYPDRSTSPPLPALPDESAVAGGNEGVVTAPQGQWHAVDYGAEAQQQLPPWQRIHARLLSWAIIWPMSELDQALNSTTRGHQVDEVALSIWSTQSYKRYVRARLTDSPQGVVDRLFVPPNMADAINNAVFNGRHGDACGMLRDLWAPFGLPGMPRLLVVLAKHRSDPNHWVVHRFSLPEGALTTYDCYPERTLPDGRPLGWWFAIRIAWPDAIYPSPDNLMQKMVRLHRPLQLPIDNSVAAGGIWRNILMGSRAERSLDLERLRDLINTEVKNLRQRKMMGKLSIGAPKPIWEDAS